MTTLRKAALVAALLAGFGAVGAVAQGPGWGGGPGGCGMAPMMMHGMGPGMMRGGGWPGASAEDWAKFRDARLTTLKEKLQITTEQEGAWNSFATVAKEHQPGRMGPPTATSGPDWFAQRTERMKERVATMEKMQGAYKQLYDVLTPAQRDIFDSGFGPRWGARL